MHMYLCTHIGLYICPSADLPKNGSDPVEQFLLARKCIIK